eukprot:878693-Pelagomonas_calceolata.AAC.1
MLMGVWRVTGSTRLQNLAVIRFVLNNTPSGNKFMSILNRGHADCEQVSKHAVGQVPACRPVNSLALKLLQFALFS